MGIHMIEPLISSWGNFIKTFSCTARAPLSRHKGHVGESRERNRILTLLSLKRSLSGSKEPSRVIILFDWVMSINPRSFTLNHFQLIILKELLPFSLSTTWRTSAKHHLPLGFLLTQSLPNLICFLTTNICFNMLATF